MSKEKKEQMGVVTLKRVRGAFLNIWTAKAFQADQEPRFSGLFLFEKNSDNHKAMASAINEVIAAKWPEKPKGLKYAMRPAEEKEEYDGFDDPNLLFVSAGSKVRPTVVDRRRNSLAQEDGVIYSGCYLNVRVRMWAQDNKWGKRINAELLGIQFHSDGEPFSAGGSPASPDDFDDLGDEDGDEPVAAHIDEDDDLLG